MLNLKSIQENLIKLERDASVSGGRTPKVLTEYGQRWLESLKKGNLLFINTNMDMEYHYDDFSQIDFTGPENENQEWRQQLNRFYWLDPLAVEYSKTKDENLALIARRTIEAWMDSHPYIKKWPEVSQGHVTGDSTLSLSIRLGQLRFSGWWGSVPYMHGSPHFDDDFVLRMYQSTIAQLEYLRGNIHKTGNWRISQLDAICFLGIILPGAEKYLEFALREINEAFRHQINPDGSHTEHNGGYHIWMMNVFTSYAILGKVRPEYGLRFDYGKVIRMRNYAIHQYAPDGRLLGLNDDGRWYDNMAPENIRAMKNERDKVIIKLGLNPKEYPFHFTGLYPDAGQYYFRQSWSANSPMVVYDITNFGGGHCHTGRGGIQFFDGSRMLLMDPGSLNYDSDDPFTAAGKQTLMHNTVTIEDLVQTTYGNARADIIADLPGAAVAVSTYTGGYCSPYGSWLDRTSEKGNRSLAARHTRSMIWIKDAFIFVIDTLTCIADHYKFRSQWQMDVGDAKLTGNGACTDYPGGNALVQAVECTSPLNCRLYKGHKEPLLGYVAKNGARLGSGEPAPMLGIEGYCEEGYDVTLAQIIVPFTGSAPPEVSADFRETGGNMYWDIRIGETKWHIAGNRQVLAGDGQITQIGEGQGLETDGLLAVVGGDARGVMYGMAVDAGYLSYDGEALFEYGETGNYEKFL